MGKQYVETEGKQKLLRNTMAANSNLAQARQGDILENFKKDLENTKESN
jgi:hypothetical protein